MCCVCVGGGGGGGGVCRRTLFFKHSFWQLSYIHLQVKFLVLDEPMWVRL